MAWFFRNIISSNWGDVRNWNSSFKFTGTTPTYVPWTTVDTAGDDLGLSLGSSIPILNVNIGSSTGAWTISGICNINSLTNMVNIYSGNFSGNYIANRGYIYGGTFSGDHFSNATVVHSGLQHQGIINGGIFTGNYFINGGGIINGGSFVNVTNNFGIINGGSFDVSGGAIFSVVNQNGIINNGTFTSVQNLGGTIFNGSFSDICECDYYYGGTVIYGGTFNGGLLLTSDAHVYGGIFSGPCTFYISCYIEGGIFLSDNIANYGQIDGGIFNGSGFMNGDGGTKFQGYIHGGTFNCDVTNNASSIIDGGIFNGIIINNDTISGGNFYASNIDGIGIIVGGNWYGTNFTNSNAVSGGNWYGSNFTNNGIVYAGTFYCNGFTNNAVIYGGAFGPDVVRLSIINKTLSISGFGITMYQNIPKLDVMGGGLL